MSKSGFFKVATQNNDIFTNSKQNDWMLYTTDSNQSIIIGSGSNTTPQISLNSNSITVSKSIIPTTNETLDLGSQTNKFKSLYIGGQTIYLGNVAISASNINGQTNIAMNDTTTAIPITLQVKELLIGSNTNVASIKVDSKTKDVLITSGTVGSDGNIVASQNQITRFPNLFCSNISTSNIDSSNVNTSNLRANWIYSSNMIIDGTLSIVNMVNLTTSNVTASNLVIKSPDQTKGTLIINAGAPNTPATIRLTPNVANDTQGGVIGSQQTINNMSYLQLGTLSPYNGWAVVGTGSNNLYVKGEITTCNQMLVASNDQQQTPGFSWSTNRNTGMFKPVDNNIGFTVAGTERVRISSEGYVGIGTSLPGYPLHVETIGANNTSIYSRSDIASFSDARFKSNVELITNALDKIKHIHGYTFTMLGEKRMAGVMAQEVQKVLPEVVSEDTRGHLHVAYGNMCALLIEAIKSLSLKIDILESKINNP